MALQVSMMNPSDPMSSIPQYYFNGTQVSGVSPYKPINLSDFTQSPLLASFQQGAQGAIDKYAGQDFSIPVDSSSYQAKDMTNAVLPEYDAMRSRLDKQYSQTQSQAQDALDRQFAAMGGGPGNGAQLKQTENLASSIAQQKGNDLDQINAQEAATRRGLQTQEENKAFESSEAAKNRVAQGNQFNTQAKMTQSGNVMNATTSLQSTLAQLQTQWDQLQAQIASENAKNQMEANAQAFNQAMAAADYHTSGGFLGLGR